jgi:single-strand DNA-binding protein
MYLNRITLIGFIGNDAERRAANSTNIAMFSLATKTSSMPDLGNRARSGIAAWPSGNSPNSLVPLTKGAHIAIEGELRSREYERELAVGMQKTTLTQRVWEIRVDSLLKLDRAAKREAAEESHEEVPQ